MHDTRQHTVLEDAAFCALSRLWNTREFLNATTDQAKGPAAYAKVTCTTTSAIDDHHVCHNMPLNHTMQQQT